MAQRLAGVSGDGAPGPSHAPAPAKPPAAARQALARQLGAALATQLGWEPADHSAAELAALGEQLIADHALNGDDADKARLLVSLARAAGVLDDAGMQHDDHVAERVAAFLASEFKDEFAVAHAIGERAALRMPTRPALARELLARVGLDPDRRMDTPTMIDPDNLLAGNDALKAGDYYFNYDRLSAGDIRDMAGRELTDDEVARRLAALPGSLDAEFSRRFDAYTDAATRRTLDVIDSQLSWIAARRGVDLKHARVALCAAQLQYYRREVEVLRHTAFVYDGKTLSQAPAQGYFATIQGAGGRHCYFLSLRDGAVHAIPPDIPPQEWAARHAGLVFGVDGPEATPGALSRDGLRTRVAVDPPMGEGGRDQVRTWLAAPLRARFDEARETARDQTPAEHSIDTLLDFVPFRRTIVAIREGDLVTAAISGGVDIMTVAIPMMGSGLRLAAGGARALVPLVRMVGREIVAGGMEAGASALASVPGLRAGIKQALKSLNATDGLARALRPLDADGMAAALRARHPRLARALGQAAARARGATMVDGWWQVPTTPTHYATDTEIVTLERLTARAPDGHSIMVMPYGGDGARAYTRVDLATGQRTGPLLLADRDGLLYRSLPVDTLERYRVAAPELLGELGTRRPGGDGAIVLRGKYYARLGDDYVEIAPDAGASSRRPLWRVVPPAGARRDIVTHRLIHDPDKALWRRADPPRLRGGGNSPPRWGESSRKRPLASDGTPPEDGASSSEKRPAGSLATDAAGAATLPSIGPSDAELDAFRQTLLDRIRGNPSPARVDAVRQLLSRLQAHPRGRAILSALRACHELLNQAPDIVLLDALDPARPRPSLALPVPGHVWHLHLDSLAAGDLDGAVRELAAVYSNMTGILRRADPYAELLRGGGPPLPAELEAAWTQWIAEDKPHYPAAGDGAFTAAKREAAVGHLRRQLQQIRCHGGLDRSALKALLRNRLDGDVLGVRVNLSRLDLAEVPPLPADLHTLNISLNPIRDWSGLPPGLKVLNAEATGGKAVLDHLPPGLQGLDVSDNALDDIPAERLPRGLRSLAANHNRLTRIPALPDTLQRLLLTENNVDRLPDDLPGNLRMLDVSSNMLTRLPSKLPPALEDLDVSENLIWRIDEGILPARLRTLDLSENATLETLPKLPQTLEVLVLDTTGLTALPDDLPRGLHELHAADIGLEFLPDNLPPHLTVLALSDNDLTRLPASIAGLTECDVYLEGNPITLEDLPPRQPGQPGPVFYLSGSTPVRPADASGTVQEAVRRWLGDSDRDAAARWDAIGRALAGDPAHADATAQFHVFLDRLRGTIYFHDEACRADIEEWLAELSKPERQSLRESSLQVCVGATERCDDRVALTLQELRKLRVHDDIRLGRYGERAADALDAMRQLYRMQKLQDIAYRKLASMPARDDVEVYMAYAVKLREPLGLTMAVPDMLFFELSGVTQADLDAALEEVRALERTDFYADLVVDDTWNALLRRALPARYEQAEARLHELADGPLRERVLSGLRDRGLDAADADAERELSRQVWREMKFQVLEPLTRDYLAAANVPLPAGAARAPA